VEPAVPEAVVVPTKQVYGTEWEVPGRSAEAEGTIAHPETDRAPA